MKTSKRNQYPAHFDLRPNRLLLDPKFQGYKLSLDKLPQFSLALESDIDHVRPSEDQYSIQHFKLQVFTNHILPDPWNPDIVYTVDQEWNVNKSAVSQQTRRLLQTRKVWSIPGAGDRPSSRFNVTLCFPDKNHAVLADGCGNFFLLFTGDRNSSKEWKVLLGEAPFLANKNSQFIILDAVSYTKTGVEAEFIDLLFVRIDESKNWAEFLQNNQDKFSSSTSRTEHPFLSVLEWITVTKAKGGESWTRESLRTFVGRSSFDYVAIEKGGTGLYVASNDPFYCSFDSEKPLKTAQEGSAESDAKKKTEYLWSQTEDKIMIWFQFPPGAMESDLVIQVNSGNISIEYKDQSVLSGQLSNPVKDEGLSWAMKDDKLEIIIQKVSMELTWTSLIPGNEAGEEVLDAEKVEHIHAQLSHLCSDKWGDHPHNSDILDTREIEEECDEFPADSSLLMRIDKHLQKISHQSSLGSHQWLFNAKTEPENAAGICLRHDVDGILWQPKSMTDPATATSAPTTSKEQGQGDTTGSKKLDWNCEHTATFSALGYVQASKATRKFTVCPKDYSYVAICDSMKHVHVYRQPAEIENDLRNRKTGERISHVAKQHVVTIESGLDILGAYAANDFMLILTAKNLIAVQMGASEIV